MKITNGKGKETQPHCVFNVNLLKIHQKSLESWTSEILKIGGSAMGIPKLANFGSEQWMLDPEGNQFLILVPYLLKGSDMEALM